MLQIVLWRGKKRGAEQDWLRALFCLPTLERGETGQSWQLVMLGEGEIDDREFEGHLSHVPDVRSKYKSKLI